MAVGGAASLAKGLLSDIDQHGGEVRLGVEIKSILVEKNRAAGVTLATGETITATGFVASGLNPQQTFLDLLPEDALSRSLPAEGGLRERAESFGYNLLAPLFGLHLALSEPPRYTATENRPDLQGAFMNILGLDRFEQFQDIVDAHIKGKIPPTVAWGTTPTLFDPSQAPPGMHTAFLWEKLPYALRGDPANWQQETPLHAKRLLETWRRYAPNLEDAAILDSFAHSPADTESTLPNMREGDLLVGSFDHDQVGYHRPFPGAGQYRTPVPGLYLCGGSTHPGGNITGLPGHNAASVIAADAGKKPFWQPPDIEAQLQSRL
jgi:phytoene dehydrogenase-like protein